MKKVLIAVMLVVVGFFAAAKDVVKEKVGEQEFAGTLQTAFVGTYNNKNAVYVGVTAETEEVQKVMEATKAVLEASVAAYKANGWKFQYPFYKGAATKFVEGYDIVYILDKDMEPKTVLIPTGLGILIVPADEMKIGE